MFSFFFKFLQLIRPRDAFPVWPGYAYTSSLWAFVRYSVSKRKYAEILQLCDPS